MRGTYSSRTRAARRPDKCATGYERVVTVVATALAVVQVALDRSEPSRGHGGAGHSWACALAAGSALRV